jgi:hypothetical protein
MKYIYTIRLALAGVLFILGLMLAHADPGKDSKANELLKKTIYFEIKAQLAAGEITLEEAQRLWKKKVKHLRKGEAK